MIEINEKYMKRCYELAINAGKKGFDTFGAVLVCDGEILEEAENTADFEKKILAMLSLTWFINVQINMRMTF